MSEYTKRPWKTKIPLDMEGMHHIFIHSSAGKKLGRFDGHQDGICCGESGYPDRAETIANARLAAAAPAMYEALAEIYQCYTCVHSYSLNRGECPDTADGDLPCSTYKMDDKEMGYYIKQAGEALALASSDDDK